MPDATAGRAPVLTYVANSIRIGDREIPYSTVSAIDWRSMLAGSKMIPDPFLLNEWAAEDLGAKIGDTVTLDYFLWSDEDGLETGEHADSPSPASCR